MVTALDCYSNGGHKWKLVECKNDKDTYICTKEGCPRNIDSPKIISCDFDEEFN